MRTPLAVLALALLPVLLPADDRKEEKPAPGTLTAKEAADGWLLLFDGETTFGWKTDGPAKVEKKKLVLGGDKAASAMTTAHFAEGEVVIDCTWKGKGRPTLTMRGKAVPALTLALWPEGKASLITIK